MTQELVTARGLFYLLNSRKNSYGSLLRQTTSYTLTRFWGAFLSECLPDPVLSPCFQTGDRRSRALSNLMNRSCLHSMPVRIFQELEQRLDENTLIHMVVWMAAALDSNREPLLLHELLTKYEAQCAVGDSWFAQTSYYFESLHPHTDRQNGLDVNKLFLLAALRVTMLGLHALCGDRMMDSQALKKLRMSHISNPQTLWKRAAELSPRIIDANFSMVQEARRSRDRLNSEQTPETILAALQSAMPREEALADPEDQNRGWYVVANWLDLRISVNDRPMPTYEGAVQLAELSNGTIVYALSAPGYCGIHASKGVWGKILWEGRPAWIPMNLTVRLMF